MPNIPLLKHKCTVSTLRPWPATLLDSCVCVCEGLLSNYQLGNYSTIALTLNTCNKKIDKLPYIEIQPLQECNVTQETEMKKYHLRNNQMILCYCFFRSEELTDTVIKCYQWSKLSSSSGHWKLVMFWTYSHQGLFKVWF